MIKKLFTDLYADENIPYFDEDSGDAVFNYKEMGIANIALNNINLDEDDPDTIVFVRLLTWHIKFEKHKALIKELHEELMLVAWYPNRW